MEENNGTATKLLGGVTGKGFLPGQSGNPSGRPRSVANIIREHTKNGAELVAFLLEAMRNDEWKPVERLKACDMLLDRGCFPKDLGAVNGGQPPVFDVEKLTDTERDFISAFLAGLSTIQARLRSGEAETQSQ